MPPNRADIEAQILANKILKDAQNASQQAIEQAYKDSITAPVQLSR